MNPTVAVFEERIAALENGIGAVATASGQAAQHLAIFTLMQAGDEFVSSRSLYGGSFQQFDVSFRKMGIDVRFVDSGTWTSGGPRSREDEGVLRRDARQPDDRRHRHRAAGGAGARGGRAADRGQHVRLAVPVPAAGLGADIVVHSATKFICGHGTTIAGVIVDGGRFPWDNGKFPGMTEPSKGYHDLRFFEYFGDFGWLMKCRAEMLRDYGPTMAPFSAWLLLQGLETLHVRMDRHVANARRVAEHLEAHPAVEYVNYPGLPSNRYHDLARKYLPKGPGSIFTFGIRGGRAAGKRFIESVQLFSHLANVGDAKSLVIHPGSTTHQQLSDEELRAAGIGPELVRVSIGIEDVEDILWDLDQALASSQREEPAGVATASANGKEGHSILSKAFGAPYQG